MNFFALLFLFLFLIAGALFFIRRERRIRHALFGRISELNSRVRALAERLENERARLETTFSGMVEGVILADQRGDILLVNPAFREMFTLKGKVEGRSALEVLASVACDDAIQEVIREKKPVEREIIFSQPARRVFQVYFSPMMRDEKLFGVVSIFHDLTEIRRLEEIRRDFIANLSHELKTPLTVIRGYCETLLEESSKFDETPRKHLEIIFRHATDLGQLTENLLNLSRIESGKEELVLESIPLRNFAARLLERYGSQAEVKQIEFHNEIPENLPALEADSSKLNQILSNLIDNAVKYTPAGGKIWIRASREGNQFQVVVQDSGNGIPRGEQERIFERFYRLNKARSRDSGGAGLGLAIVKHLVELHAGRISVESAPGRGSQFKIIFPDLPAPHQNKTQS